MNSNLNSEEPNLSEEEEVNFSDSYLDELNFSDSSLECVNDERPSSEPKRFKCSSSMQIYPERSCSAPTKSNVS